MRIVLFVGWLGVACLAASAARAEGCGPLHRVASVEMIPDPGGVMLVPVSINGTPLKLMLDTGGLVPSIAPSVAVALKLRLQRSPLKMFDATGNVTKVVAIADSFAIGPMTGRNLMMQIDSAQIAQMADGLVTPSLFAHLDMDLDFAGRRFNLFLPDHCPGQVLYWKADTLAVVPMTMRDLHIHVPVTVDGKSLRAMIDTGASLTTMNMDVARRLFDLGPDSPGVTASDDHPNNDRDVPLYRYVFSTLSFGGVAVRNAHVMLMPDRTGSKDLENHLLIGSIARHENDGVERPQLVIGMDVLKQLHLYIATDENKLYITAAGPAEAAAK